MIETSVPSAAPVPPPTPAAAIPPLPSAPPASSGQKRVARNVATTVATQIVSWALTFLVTYYLPGYIKADGNGKLATATTFVALFSVVASLGVSPVLIKEIARNRSRLSELLVIALFLRLPVALGLFGMAQLTALLTGYSELIRIMICLSSFGLIMAAVNDAFGATLQGTENLSRQNAIMLAEKALNTTLVLCFIFLRLPLWIFALVGPLSNLISFAAYLWTFKGIWRELRFPAWRELKWLASAGWPFLGWSIFQTLYGMTDTLVLSKVTNDATVGWYFSAFKLINTTLFFPMAIATALLPTLARLYTANDTESFQRLARKMLEVVLLCGVPIAVVFAAAAGPIFKLLPYGETYDGAIPVLQVGALSCLMYYVGCVLGTLVNAIDQQKQMLGVTIRATIIGIPRCVIMAWLTQKYMGNGAIGAMFSGALLEVFLVYSYLKILPKGLFDVSSLWRVARYALASVPMALLLWWIAERRGSILWAILCLPIYVAGLFLLRAVDKSDLTLLKNMAQRKG